MAVPSPPVVLDERDVNVGKVSLIKYNCTCKHMIKQTTTSLGPRQALVPLHGWELLSQHHQTRICVACGFDGEIAGGGSVAQQQLQHYMQYPCASLAQTQLFLSFALH